MIIGFYLSSCNFSSCPSKVDLGKYHCYKNKNAVNYLELMPNGKFYHYYKNADVELENWGKWNKRKDECVIELENWKNFNEKGEDYEDFPLALLFINGSYLDETPDGDANTSFRYISKE